MNHNYILTCIFFVPSLTAVLNAFVFFGKHIRGWSHYGCSLLCCTYLGPSIMMLLEAVCGNV